VPPQKVRVKVQNGWFTLGIQTSAELQKWEAAKNGVLCPTGVEETIDYVKIESESYDAITKNMLNKL